MADFPERPPIDRKARFQIPHQDILKQDPSIRSCNWNEVVLGFENAEAAMIEANRCIQCPAAPCINACPLHNDIPGALWELEQGNFIEAANVFRITSTMPEVCGRICPQERLCEGSCVVGNQKRIPATPPVSIGLLEAFAADQQRASQGYPVPPIAPATGKRLAIIGSGPAGLTVAELAAQDGHKVVIYESWPKPGGIMRYGIPSFKMSKEITEEKISLLEKMGIEFRCNTTIGKDISFNQLAEENNAIYLAHGAGIHASTGAPGEDLPNIHWATDFLAQGNIPVEELPEYLREPLHLGNQIVIIGGGDTSMDCVRSAVRLAKIQGLEATVTCLYRRTETEMPGREEERTHAKEEGVEFRFFTAPVRFIPDSEGAVAAVECVKMELGEPDSSGRPRPEPVRGSEHLVPADTVILAVGYNGDAELAENARLNHRWGLILIDQESGMTNRPGVFAGGDSVRGSDLVVTALAQARTTAIGILEYLAKTPA